MNWRMVKHGVRFDLGGGKRPWRLGVARSRFKQRNEGNKWSWGMLKAEEKACVRLGVAERGSGTGWARRAVAAVRRQGGVEL